MYHFEIYFKVPINKLTKNFEFMYENQDLVG